MWKYINLADSPGWVKKVTADCGGFFSVVGSWGIVGWIYGAWGMGRFMRRAGNENEKKRLPGTWRYLGSRFWDKLVLKIYILFCKNWIAD